jgi:hypothetical protein
MRVDDGEAHCASHTTKARPCPYLLAQTIPHRTRTCAQPTEETMNGNAVLWAIFLVLGIIVMIIWLITRFT